MHINLKKTYLNRLKISKSFFIYFPVVALIIIVAGFRPIGLDLDSNAYIEALSFNVNFIDKEPTFWIIRYMNNLFFQGNIHFFFLIYAIIGVSIKLYVIRKFSVSPIFSFATYISMFFILQEMTQIRAGVAIGIVFWAINDVVKKQAMSFLLKIFMATLFHYSAIIMLIFYFFSTEKKIMVFYFLLPIIGIAMSFSHVLFFATQYLASVLPEFLSAKLKIYLFLMKEKQLKSVTPFNFGNFFMLSVYYLNFIFFDKLKLSEFYKKYYLLCLKLLGWGFFILFGFSFIEVFAYRLANYSFFSLVFLLPLVIEFFCEKYFMFFFLTIYLIYTLVKNINIMLKF
ncbi:conserved hypothetical protein [Chloroherpeton thalassium ATCC 35110]|uniref:EpsG family protein n=1 Tax=Chloroherpeton thalassium (strain ATCC 35110 / GB-78) TaxID=517418 RepID=B3QVC2_CHLT3|nr:EpsG family protein [Chloroherpeton thalassium]ACF14522.1 conserved hypothetical protein [Chloroherpeton thalassium ATCC 35110]